MRMMFPLVLDAEQPAADVVAQLQEIDAARRPEIVVVRQRERLNVVWWIADVAQLLAACGYVKADETIATAMLIAPFHLGVATTWDRATPRDISARTAHHRQRPHGQPRPTVRPLFCTVRR